MGRVSERTPRRRAWLRLAAYVIALQCAVTALAVREVQARTDRALSHVGTLLMEYVGAKHQQAPRTLMLNGAEIKLSVGNTDHSVSTVIDHFHKRCDEHSGGLGKQLRALAQGRRPLKVGPEDAALDGVLRVQSESRGVLACVDTGAGALSIADLAARARAFVTTGDLSRLGNLRFVSVERGEVGTVFVAVWNEGPLNIGEMFPESGDAPGHDLPRVPRPMDSRRIASAWEVGQRRSFGVYEIADRSLSQVTQQFRQQLQVATFEIRDGGSSDVAGFVAERGELSVMVAFAQADLGRTLVTISSLSDATAAVTTR